jgi:hypothetical protein
MSNLYREYEGKKASVTVSCRFDKKLYDVLKTQAESDGVSLNSLIASILKRYVAWERFALEIGFIPLAKETIRLIFEELDDRKMMEIARYLGTTIPRELILLMYKRIDFESILSFLDITLSRYGAVQHNMNGESHEFILYHGVNEKFSRFLSEIAKSMADDFSCKLRVLNMDSKIISISIEENSSSVFSNGT